MNSRPVKPGGVFRAAGRVLHEEGAVYKDWGGRLPVALVYPNTYYLGMSNLGIHAMYRLLNSRKDVVCERVFLEDRPNMPPVSLESGRPLTDFAVAAFSFSYELDYFNAAAILRDSGIPFYSSQRDESHPLIMAGGPCVTANPMPVAPFFDCMGIGEAEVLFPAILPLLPEGIGGDRRELLEALSRVPGIFVPSLAQEQVARQWVKNLDEYPASSVITTRETELGDLYLIEAERGCQRGCRFCLVNGAFSPMRFRSASSVLEQAEEGLKVRGRIGLVGPAVTDHPEIIAIINGVRELGGEMSVSSLRISSLSDEIIAGLARGGAKTLTIAPEAGSQRLRDVIDKRITEDDIFRTVESIARYNFTNLKLYFIVGLPTETDADIADMITLVQSIKAKLGGGTRITVNAGPFVPKAGTPFQWLPMAPREILARRLKMLQDGLPLKGIRVTDESPAWSLVQGVLSRGDDKLAPVIAGMKKLTLSSWKKAVEEHRLDIDYYVNRRWYTDVPLPWSVVEGGPDTGRLCAGLERALGE